MRKFPLPGLLLAAAVALPAAGCAKESPQDKAFGERVRAYLLAHPEVIQEAVDKLQTQREARQQAEARSAIAAHRQALERDPRDFVAGNPNGAVTVVEFFDYRCPFCKASEPAVVKLLRDHKDVRLVLKEFPILDAEDNTKISEDAARAALAAKPQGKYLAVHEAMLGEKHLDEAGIQRILKDKGVDLIQAKTLAQDPATGTHLAENRTLARTLGIDGTPTFIIGDKLIQGARMDEIEAAIAAAREANKSRG